MTRLYITFIICLLDLPLAALTPILACPPSSGTTLSHMCYMFAHGGILHWAVNAWAFICLHNVLTPRRLAASYAVAVAVSYIPLCHLAVSYAGGIHLAQRPVVGASVMTAFFIGLIIRRQMAVNPSAARTGILVMIAGLLIPGIAALHHIVPFFAGMAYRRLSLTLRNLQNIQ